MADEAVPADGAGHVDTEQTLAGFHKAMTKRTQERDAAREEAATLRQQIAGLAALSPDDGDEDDGTVYRRQRDGTYVEADSPTPRGQNAPREFRRKDEEPDFDMDGPDGYPV